MPRHHMHTVKNEHKKNKLDLQTLREGREEVETLKAALLEHNNVIALSKEAVEPVAESFTQGFARVADAMAAEAKTGSIKGVEDEARIARNTAKLIAANLKAQAPAPLPIMENLNQLMDIQRQCLGLMLQSWGAVFQLALSAGTQRQ